MRFPDGILASRSWIERQGAVAHWTETDQGGHFMRPFYKVGGAGERRGGSAGLLLGAEGGVRRLADEFERVEVESRTQLRTWLSAHHKRTQSVWLVSYKKAAGKKYLPYGELVEEALCFGWVDSRPCSLDELRSMRLLSPRKPGSAWSRANKERAERLIREGRMTKAGLAKIEAAKRDGSWTFLDDVEDNVAPDDLAAALARDPAAAANFEAFPPSSQRIILEWIKQAKRPETRAKRIAETAQKAARNVRANHYRQ